MDIVDGFRTKLEERGIRIVSGSHRNLKPRGGKMTCYPLCIPFSVYISVGYGHNCAIRQSSGKYICIQDAVSLKNISDLRE